MSHRLKLTGVLLVFLVGCSDSTAPVNNGSPAADKPSVVSIAAQATSKDVPLDVTVTISDKDVSSVTMSASSDNAALIDESGMVFSGAGDTRTLTLTPKPDETGTATITVSAKNGSNQAGSASFALTVNAAPSGLFQWSELLLASDGDVASDFGHSVRASGDLIVVGTRDINEGGTTYVFRKNGSTWTETWKVSQFGSFFGNSIATNGDYLASAKSGTTYLYSRDTPAADSWTPEGTLPTSGLMDMSGNRLLIVNPVQVATVYTRDAGVWTASGAPNPGGLDADDAFGSSVALDGDVAVIGATGDDDGATDTGAVYVFRFNGTTWEFEQKLKTDDALANDRIGRSVAVEGDMIVVGVPYINNGTTSGAAYVFTHAGGTWTQRAKVAEGTDRDLFGTSVDIDAGEFVVGAISAYKDGRSGAAYHFTGSGANWIGTKLAGTGSHEHDAVGASVAINGDVIVLGAPGDDDQGSNSGSAHLFVR